MPETLEDIRLKHWPSIGSLAKSIGKDPSTVWKWENGVQEPSSDEDRAAYAKALRISTAKLGSLIYAGAAK